MQDGGEFSDPVLSAVCCKGRPLRVTEITTKEVVSQKWKHKLVIFFFKVEVNTEGDGWVASPFSYVLRRDDIKRTYTLERYGEKESGETPYDDNPQKADDEYIKKYLEFITGKDEQAIQENWINKGASVCWDIPNPEPNTTSPEPTPTPHVHNWQHGVIYPASEGVEGLEGDYCTDCNLTRNTSPIPAAACIMENRTQQIEWASPAKTSILEMTTLCSLPNYFMKMIDAKKNCDFTMRFTYNKKHYEIYIPAGTQFDNSLDWYGPEQLLAMFEYKELY